jgi:hypothetical protein
MDSTGSAKRLNGFFRSGKNPGQTTPFYSIRANMQDVAGEDKGRTGGLNGGH